MNSKPRRKALKITTKSQQVYENLYSEIQAMSAENNKLPAEEILAEEFGVSRATIRDAIVRLKMERVISSHQGIGTFGHPSAFRLANRIDLNTDFGVMLKQQYKNVTVSASWKYNDDTANIPNYEAHFGPKPAVQCDWTYSADGLKRLYTRFYFPSELITKPLDKNLSVQSLPEFSKKYMLRSNDEGLRNSIDYCSMKCVVRFDDNACDELGIAQGTPLMCFDEVFYSISDNVTGVGEVFVHPENLVISLVAPFTD